MAAHTSFVSEDGSVRRHCRVLTVDFSHLEKLQELQPWSGEEVLHAVAGVCSMSLPDMEVPAIYNTLTTSTTILALADPAEALKYCRKSKRTPTAVSGSAGVTHTANAEAVCDEESSCFSGLISGEESSDSESEGGKDDEDPWAKSRDKFLAEARQRASRDRKDISGVGPEHCVLGCASFLKLGRGSNAVQITLLAVRKSCRRLGIGRHLMQLCKDPEVVGLYDALLTFADPKAEKFFHRHGFHDDPILTAKFKGVVDCWENSTLVVYTPPFSTTGLRVGSIKSLIEFQDAYKGWRDSAIENYSTQLCVMERLRHELLLLNTKVQSQEEVISELTTQLSVTRQKYSSLEMEFSQYRKHTQKMLCSTAVENAEKWLENQN